MRVQRLKAWAVSSCGILGCLAATAPSDRPASVAKPPLEAAVKSAWPQQAKALDRGGWAAAQCQVSTAGAVTDCRIVHENPPQLGFGEALLGLIPSYGVKPAIVDGRPAPSQITISASWYDFDTGPDWLKKPTADSIMGVWPREALQKGLGGRALVSCLVTTQGALADCILESEWPTGQQFGQAALALTPQLQMKPARRKGEAVLSVVRVPFDWVKGSRDIYVAPKQFIASGARVWLTSPTAADVAAAYPSKARADRTPGRVTLSCRVWYDGKLLGCLGLAEEPQAQGFGLAALKLASLFRADMAGAPPGAVNALQVNLQVVFDPKVLDGQPVVGRPEWAGLPDEDDVKAAFASMPKDVATARVTLMCTVEQVGRLSGCAVGSETPSGRGLGEAALRLTPKFRVNTWTNEGLPVVGGQVQIPIRYQREEDSPAAAPAKP